MRKEEITHKIKPPTKKHLPYTSDIQNRDKAQKPKRNNKNDKSRGANQDKHNRDQQAS